MEEKIETLANQIFEDVQKLRSGADEVVSQRTGFEIMALNAICNAYKALREKE